MSCKELAYLEVMCVVHHCGKAMRRSKCFVSAISSDDIGTIWYPAIEAVQAMECCLAAAAHQVKEVHIGLGGLHVFEHQLHRLDLIHVVHKLAQDAGFLQNFGR